MAAVRLKSAGAGGRMATAGVSAKTPRSTTRPPAEAARTDTVTPVTKDAGSTRNTRKGNL